MMILSEFYERMINTQNVSFGMKFDVPICNSVRI